MVSFVFFFRECHLNRTLYETLQLERVLNVTSLEEMVRRMNIRAEVRRLADAMRVDTSSLVLLSGTSIRKKNKLEWYHVAMLSQTVISVTDYT